MNFRQLLLQRTALIRAARLANVAFAYDRLREFARRIECAGLGGVVTLHPVDPDADRFMPVLVAHAGSQAVIDEHFVDEDVIELADVLQFLNEEDADVELTFALGEIGTKFLPWARGELERAGVAVRPTASANDGAPSESPSSSH